MMRYTNPRFHFTVRIMSFVDNNTAAGFNWLFRRRLWFSLDVGRHKLLGYRTAPPAVMTTTRGDDKGSRSSSASRSSRDEAPQPTVSINLRSAGIYANPTEKYQFTVA